MAERFVPEPGFASTPDGIGLYVELASEAESIAERPEEDVPKVRRVIIEDLLTTPGIGGFRASQMAGAQIQELRARGYFPPAPESDSTEPLPPAA